MTFRSDTRRLPLSGFEFYKPPENENMSTEPTTEKPKRKFPRNSRELSFTEAVDQLRGLEITRKEGYAEVDARILKLARRVFYRVPPRVRVLVAEESGVPVPEMAADPLANDIPPNLREPPAPLAPGSRTEVVRK